MSPHATLALIVTGTAAWWLLRLYFHPFRPCPRCRGRGTNRTQGDSHELHMRWSQRRELLICALN